MTDRTVLVRLKAHESGFVASMKNAERAVRGLRHEIDTTNDRTAWLAQGILAIGPTLAPLGAAAVPAVAGLATQMGLAAAAAGTAAMAFIGVGDALGAVNDYQLEPSAQNLEAMRIALEKLGPAGADFVRFLDAIGPKLNSLRLIAREGMFPGMTEGLDELLDERLPQFRSIVHDISTAMGNLAREAGQGLSGEGFNAFFDYLDNEARPLLQQMGRAFGNFAEGFANLLVGFRPLTADFSRGMLDMSRSFATWARGLEDNDSFQAFIDYVQQSTPKALDFLGSLVDAFVALLKAAAPVGDVMLPVLSQFLDIVAAIAETPLGPIFLSAAAAMSVYGRAAALASITTGGLGKVFAQTALNVDGLKASLRGADRSFVGFARAAGPAAATAGAFAFSMSGMAEDIGLSKTAMGAMIGTIAGPWGVAIGGAVGLMLDLTGGTDRFKISVSELKETLDDQTGAITENTEVWAANELAKQGVLSAANSLGLNLQDVTDAALGNTSAMRRVSEGLDAARAGFESAGGQTAVSAEELDNYRVASHLVAGAIGETNGTLGEAREEMELTAEATSGLEDSWSDAEYAAESFRREVERVNRVLSRRASFRDYEQALDDFTSRSARRAEILGEIADAEQERRQDQVDNQRDLANAREDLRNADTAAEREAAQERINSINSQIAADDRAAAERVASLREQADELKNSLNIDTQAGRDTQAALDDIAATAIKVAENLEGIERKKFLAGARRDFIDAAIEAGKTREKAKELATELGLVDLIHSKPKVTMDRRDFIKGAEQVETRMNALDGKTATMYVNVRTRRTNETGGFGPVPEFARGGAVRGRGTATSDSIPAWLSNGEYVVKAAAVSKYGAALFDRLNAMQYAGGGFVQAASARASQPVYGGGIDYDRLAKIVLSARPLYGDVKWTGTYDEFLRMMRDDARLHGSGGVG